LAESFGYLQNAQQPERPVTEIRKVVSNEFGNRFGGYPIIVRSPGRINLIGEHTDYNEGYVLPGAIDKAVYVAVGNNNSDRINLFAIEYNEVVAIRLEEVRPSAEHPWTNYILGVVDQLSKRGCVISGFNLVIAGDIPLGAGLSSSAAVECATALALNHLFGLKISKLDLVKLSQKAEHEFAGVKCGIMDQFASMFGKKDHVIKLDCRSLDYEYIQVRMDGYKILLFDTRVKHSLASSEYNTRREECEHALSLIRKNYPNVSSLRDATPEMVEECVKPAGRTFYNRAKFVVDEIERVKKACEDLRCRNLDAFGKEMFATHKGLSELYEVSCEELDFLVDEVSDDPAVLGARMMGGGFGGCTINLIREQVAASLTNRLKEAYKKQFGIDLKSCEVSLEEGTSIVS
jgi:galactokinase